MAGAILALAAAFAVTINVQTGVPIVGAVLFPVGFCMLYLLGFDLLTGVFVLCPLALIDKRPGVHARRRAAQLGPRLHRQFRRRLHGGGDDGDRLHLRLLAAEPNKVGQVIGTIGESRTSATPQHGAAGMLTLFVRGMLCNWMVSTGVVGAMISTHVSGKVIAMWMPIMLFFFMTFEHSIVNMFLFPSGLLLGGKFTWLDYIFWNEIPTVIGNLVGGLAFTGLTLYATHISTGPSRKRRPRRRRERVCALPLDLAMRTGLSCGARPVCRDSRHAARAENIGRAVLRQGPQGDQPGFPRRPDPGRAAAQPQGHRHRAGRRHQHERGQPRSPPSPRSRAF